MTNSDFGLVVVILLLVIGWFVLMRFILPRLGVST
jgi:p-aminobenzoyl-glutamate transporter AbgT